MAGYKNASTMIAVVDDLLASTEGIEMIDIVIKDGTADAGNPEATSVLRKGLVLTKFTSGADSGKYSNHDSADILGLADESNAVVVASRVEMVAGQDSLTAAYFRASLKTDKLIVDDSVNFDWSAVQRLRLK